MEENISNLSIEFSQFILPYIGIMISIVFFLWFKDFAIGISKGLKFKIDPHFQEGDEVWLEDEPAVILKIGMTQTIFGIVNGRGYIWRFIDNESIFEMKLEKIVSDKIHYDTETEQSKKMRELLSLTEEQDDLITKNRLKDLEQDEIIEAIEKYNDEQDSRLKEHKEHIDKMVKNFDKSD
jgi:hypothetical protein